MRKLIVLILVLIVSQNIFAQSGWVQQNPFLEQTLNCTFFINENTGWAAGEEGTVKLTTNGGINWTTKIPDESMKIITIHFLNNLTGFIAGSSGKVYKSSDGGNNWAALALGLTGNVNQILFTDASTGYICGNNSVIMRTTNAGNNWTMRTIPSANDFYAMSFLNNNTGWISTMRNAMYKTTNGGMNWTSLSNTNVYQQKVRSVQFINDNTGWVFGDNGSPYVYGMLTKTTDGGSSWTVQSLPAYFVHYTAKGNVFFLDDQKGYACGSNYSLWRTTNSGVNWINSPMYSNNSFNSIYILPNQKGFAVGENGTIVKTEDGYNWSFIHDGYEAGILTAKYFLNANTGWFSGDNYIYTTSNGGTNWRKYHLGNKPTSRTNSIWFMNENSGLICGTQASYSTTDNYFFKKSSDGGKTWQDINVGFFPADLCFINTLTGYASGEVLRKTTDGGLTWLFEANVQTVSTFYISENNGWGFSNTGMYKQVFRLTGGVNWTAVSSFYQTSINSICFVNSTTGWLSNGYLLKTTNGGISWDTNRTSFGHSIQFLNANTGWAWNPSSRLFKTTNAGSTWNDLNLQVGVQGLNVMHFENENTGWIGSSNGVILKTTTGGVSVKQISSEVPDKFFLSQNYPNPFNPSTRINYELRNSNYVSLKVFDLLGKEVATLVNEKQNAGSYAVDFNSTEFNLPSGIYFYTLNAGEFKETKKMVLVK